MTSPEISICIPSYNGEKYLRQCLDSCISQTYSDFEIVICDDCSTDATVLIAEEYQKMWPSIHLHINARNLGLVGNWNHCISLAKGKWIKFLFQDDEMDRDCLLKFKRSVTAESHLLVCRRNFVLDKRTTSEEKDYYTNRVRTLENTGSYHSSVFEPKVISRLAVQNIALNFIAEPSLTFFRKDLVTMVGFFDEELKQICDLEFFLRIASNFGLVYVPEQLCAFRIHADSTTEKNIKSESYHQAHLESLLFAAKLLQKPQFKKLVASLSHFQLIKLKLYIKYKSFLAFKAIKSEQDRLLYESYERTFSGLFFKKIDSVYLRLISFIK